MILLFFSFLFINTQNIKGVEISDSYPYEERTTSNKTPEKKAEELIVENIKTINKNSELVCNTNDISDFSDYITISCKTINKSLALKISEVLKNVFNHSK